jgi:hypothetical protein
MNVWDVLDNHFTELIVLVITLATEWFIWRSYK